MAFKKNIFVTSALLSSLLLVSCTPVKEKVIVEKQAPANMLQSFSKSIESTCEKLTCVTIQKDSLGKIFLLISSGKTAGSTPQWYDLKPLVVSFEKSGTRLALMAENYNSIYEEIRTSNLIQTFQVVGEDEKTVTFDWAEGLKTFVIQSSYDVDGPRGKNNDLTESSFSSLPVVDSFVRGIKFDEKNIELEQISKVRVDNVKQGEDKSMSIEPREETLAMNIQIRPYDLSSGFKKKEYDAGRNVGFFVTKVSKQGYSQDVTNLITKWDLSPEKGPIVVRISAAVPAEYLEAIKEAALYWNKVFGQDVIAVKTGVDPQAGPEDRSIFIRWIPWLDSGAAYAIGQSDPLTGELLRAQIFMPSVFTRVGSADLVSLNGGTPVVAVGAVACDLTQKFLDLNKMAREASDSQRLRLAQDGVRATVAHEIGHALGLRHNFSGSYSAKVKTPQIQEAAKTYLQDLSHKGLETSTSIMDYVSGIDEILMSSRLKYAALSYDKMAMEWAYSDNDDALDESISQYCTDDDIALANSQGLQIYGCVRFDAGNNPLLRKFLDAKSEKENFVRVLFASLVGRTFPGDQPSVVNNLDTVLRDTMKWGKVNLDNLQFVSQVLMDMSKGTAPAPVFASLDFVKAGKILDSKVGLDSTLRAERIQSLVEAGGYANLLDGLLRRKDGSIDLDWLNIQIEELRQSPYLAKGKTLSGREYSFTPEEQDKILQFFAGLNAMNANALLKGTAALLPQVGGKAKDQSVSQTVLLSLLPKGALTADDAEKLADLYVDLENVRTETVIFTVGAGLKKPVQVVKSKLIPSIRVEWAKLLSSKGLRFDMDVKRAQVHKAQFNKVSAFLKEVKPELDLAEIKQPDELGKLLLQEGLIDPAASAWLNSETAVLIALEK